MNEYDALKALIRSVMPDTPDDGMILTSRLPCGIMEYRCTLGRGCPALTLDALEELRDKLQVEAIRLERTLDPGEIAPALCSRFPLIVVRQLWAKESSGSIEVVFWWSYQEPVLQQLLVEEFYGAEDEAVGIG